MHAVELLERGRASYARGAWRDAHEAFSSADHLAPLAVEDLELLATVAYMLGNEPEYVTRLERAHRIYLDDGETLRAARVAFWIGMHLTSGGEIGQGSGWLGRTHRLVDRVAEDCVERGYLLIPLAFQQEAAGELDAAAATAGDAAAVAERFGDKDGLALSIQLQGQLLVRRGRVVEGLALLDEAMVAVTAGELSPIVTGLVYCGVIMGCQTAYEPRRAQEWTAALTQWCERQPDMVAYSGRCHVHRAEIMQLKGAWPDALEEARHATRRAAKGNHRGALAGAAYVQGEVHRLRGDFEAAEQAYREASRYGREAQPGLALLRLEQHKMDAAVAAIRRALDATTDPADRVSLLPAYAEIMLAAGDVAAARVAGDELGELATGRDVGFLSAIVAHTRGAIDLADGDAAAALPALRRAMQVWAEIDAPYEAARVRALMGAACRALEDEDAAALEFEVARREFEALGAEPDVARIDALAGARESHGLTARELEVLRLVAAGRTNRAIAAELVLSERTVDRHVSNIFAKLVVTSRAAATAYAYEHRLL